MKNKIKNRSTCPISTALDIFGDKWSLLIIRDLMFKGKNTYGQFLDGEEKIATNILADRLITLDCAGIISKHGHPESKVKHLYKLTEKGINLLPTLVEIVLWSARYEAVDPYAIEFAKVVMKNKPKFVKQAQDRLRE